MVVSGWASIPHAIRSSKSSTHLSLMRTYSAVSRKRQATNREQGAASPYQNNQSEHLVANSAFGPDRAAGTNIPSAPNYSEGSGYGYSVYDDQSEGTEHSV